MANLNNETEQVIRDMLDFALAGEYRLKGDSIVRAADTIRRTAAVYEALLQGRINIEEVTADEEGTDEA